MSHTTAIKSIRISSASALRAAVQSLAESGVRCSLHENTAPRAFYQEQEGMGVADFVLRLDDAPYDVGFYRMPDGSFEPRTDFFRGLVEAQLGGKPSDASTVEQAKLGKLFMHYGAAAATEQAIREGRNVMRQVTSDGAIQLVITGNM